MLYFLAGLLSALVARGDRPADSPVQVHDLEEQIFLQGWLQRKHQKSIGALVDQVNVLAGTKNHDGSFSEGNVLPIIARPWGFNHWAVQSRHQGFWSRFMRGTSNWWFDPGDTTFSGIRCTHQPSPWIGDYGHFLVSPSFAGSSATGMVYNVGQSTWHPYLFQTTLYDGGNGMGFQLVPTMRGAAFFLTPPTILAGSLNFSLPSGSWTLKNNSKRIVGGGMPNGDHGETLFVAVESDDEQAVWHFKGQLASLVFPTGSPPVLVRLGTSFISAAQAELNLEEELGRKTFQVLQNEGKHAWETLLGRVEVEFPDPKRSEVFYSNLYRGMLFPRFLWEFDKEGKMLHRSPFTNSVRTGRAVTDEGFWDSYRTHYPMLSLLFPDILGQIVDGWINTFEERGWLPNWSSYNQRRSMVGTMGDCPLADAVVKSSQGLLSGFNRTRAFEAIYKDATIEPAGTDMRSGLGRVALQAYLNKGYAPSDNDALKFVAGEQSATLTLNYNLADACVSFAADALGKADLASALRRRSRSFRSIFDNETKYFRPMRTNGKWDHKLQPNAWGFGFTEASPTHYRFEAPHDVPGLVELMGGREQFCKNMEDMFASKPDFNAGSYGSVIHEMKEAAMVGRDFGQYAHNNQPVHAVLYVGLIGGCTSFAQKNLRKVMEKLYTRDGWPGDEDNGEMSSWYVLSSLGLYSLVPGSDDLVLGSPEVREARLSIPGRPNLEIHAPHNSDTAVYVRAATFNDQKLAKVVSYSELARTGGTLRFHMSPTPAGS